MEYDTHNNVLPVDRMEENLFSEMMPQRAQRKVLRVQYHQKHVRVCVQFSRNDDFVT
jgi:hypothetical protein